MAGPFISFLTDFGTGATAPSVCRGVMLGIAPEARILDLTHAVRPFAVRDGAFLLWTAVPYLPVGVHLAVVDPGVGTQRRGVAIQTGRGAILVGPDNGLLRPAAERLGGAVAARELTNRALWRDTVSHTFHGRAIFSPVAAPLATGEPCDSAGDALALDELVALELPQARVRAGGLDTAVLFIDAFGNCRLAGELADLERAIGPTAAGKALRITVAGPDGTPAEYRLTYEPTFGRVEPGTSLVYEDADYAGLGLAVNQGSAATRYRLTLDDPVRIEPA